MPGTAVAVTGVSGLLGQRLLSLLDADAGIERIVGLDVRDPARRARKLEFHRVDLTAADLAPLLHGVDTVVHLAGVVDVVPDERILRRVNVDTTRNLLAAAAVAGVRKVIRPSCSAVYGAWPNNPVPLTEESPLRPSPGFVPAEHDAECERMLAEWAVEHPGSVVTRLRLAPVVGPGAHTLLAAVAAGRAPVRVRNAAPAVQVVHVDDAAAALQHAVAHDLDGPYNVSADGWLRTEEAAALQARRLTPALPPGPAERVLGAGWGTGLGDAPPALLPYLQHPWVVANDRLRASGWQPRHTNEEALLLSGPAEPRVGGRIWLAAAAGGLVGAGLAGWWWRRRRAGRSPGS